MPKDDTKREMPNARPPEDGRTAEEYARLARDMKGAEVEFVASGESPHTISGVHYVPSGDLKSMLVLVPPASLQPRRARSDEAMSDALAGSRWGKELLHVAPDWYSWDRQVWKLDPQAALRGLCHTLSGLERVAAYLDDKPGLPAGGSKPPPSERQQQLKFDLSP